MERAIDIYADHQRGKGNKEGSIHTTSRRMRLMFPDDGLFISTVTPQLAERLYGALVQSSSVDTHRNSLGQTRTFFKWAVRQGYLSENPFAAVEGVGKRSKGKEQLRIDEARKLVDACNASGMAGTAVKLALFLGLRTSEIIGLRGRDVDDGGSVLWVAQDDGKTAAARRKLDVPPELVEELLALKEAADSGLLFGGKKRDWVYRQSVRLCNLAGVPPVSAHGLRGTHISIASDFGTTGAVVASAVGHTSEAVTKAHYAKADAVDRGQAKRARLRLVK